MKKKPPISKEDLIQKIESRLQQPDVPLREFTSLTKRLANRRGWVRQGVYTRTAQQSEPQESEPRPSFLTDEWMQIFIAQRASGENSAVAYRRWGQHLNEFEAKWAASEGIGVEALRQKLREGAEFKAYSDEEVGDAAAATASSAAANSPK
jgi:hypothetical protein